MNMTTMFKKWKPPYTPPDQPDLVYINSILTTLWSDPDGSLPRLGNPHDPVEDLIYLVMSRRSKINTAKKVFDDIRKSVTRKGQNKPDWSSFFHQDIDYISTRLSPLGMGKLRARELTLAIKKIENRFGFLTLEQLKDWNYDQCLVFLCSLPGVNIKTAACVMLFTLDKKIFPADAHCIRILSRLGIIPAEFGRKEMHKKAQEFLLDGRIPAKLAYSLHVTLIRHGQEVCTSKRPRCGKCPLRGFCTEYRQKSQTIWHTQKHLPSCVDLFSGAGGTSIGISRPIEWGHSSKASNIATMRIALAAEIDRWAHKTYCTNHPEVPVDRVLLHDLTSKDAVKIIKKAVSDEPNLVLVFGGPPCQNVSLIGTTGRRAATASRQKFDHPTYVAFRNIVKSLKSLFFVMENVPGLLAAADGLARDDIISDFSDIYCTKAIRVEANLHGVPQRRQRVLIFGVLKEKNPKVAPIALEFLSDKLIEPLDRIDWNPTFGEAVSDLPELGPSDGNEFALHVRRESDCISGYQESLRNGSDLIYNHVARPNNKRDLELYSLLKPGEIARDAHEKYNRHDLMVYRNDIFLDKYRRQVWDAPSTTVVAHLAKDGHMFIHPRQVRSITVREAARLQSFPDDFIFTGCRTEQFRQVGNAVPPLLGARIRSAVLETLDKFFGK